MKHFKESNHDEKSQKLQVWCCDHCQAVHFKAGNVLLNFSRTEFTELTRAVMEIYSQEFGALEFYRMLNSIDYSNELLNQDDILLSQTIA